MAKKKRKFETPNILSDLPLVGQEAATFHFDEFAITLARLIADKNTKTPLTIGISGAWGSGKTTLLWRIKQQLDETLVLLDGTKPAVLDFVNEEEVPQQQYRACRTVWFDVWKYAGEDQILAALLRVIVEEMRRDGFWNKIKAEIKGPKKEELKWLDLFTSALTQFASAGTYNLNLPDFKVDTPLKEASAFFDYFDESFKRLLAAWLGEQLIGGAEIDEAKGVLVIFIDDLDRCLPKKIIEVLEAVKLFLDKTGCIFVLAAHTDIIREAVKKHYIEEGLKEPDANDYLDKFIQLRFDLPPASEDEMKAYVKHLAEYGTLSEHWRLVTIGAGYNPRKVKVFLNSLSLRWTIWKNVWQTGQVEYDDFVRWEVWMGSAPKFRLRVLRVYDKDDLSILTNLVEAAFRWVEGDDEAIASFKEDVTDQMHRVLREILPFRERFTPEVLDSLLHLAAQSQVEEEEEKIDHRLFIRAVEFSPEVKEALLEGAPPVLNDVTRGAKVDTEEVGVRSGFDVSTFAEMPFIHIPGGKFLVGSKDGNKLAADSECPQHTLELPEFYMARFPVTNEQYLKFTDATDYVTFAENEGGEKPGTGGFEKGFNWQTPLGQNDNIGNKLDHPVVQITWRDVMEYVRWLNEVAKDVLPRGYAFILPTEAQWEKAARGEYGNEWPWGNEFDKNKCNSSESKKGNSTPVNAYPAGASPYGVMDMVGNVWEWTHTLYKEYPYKLDDGRESEEDAGRRVLRGGSFKRDFRFTRCASRSNNVSDTRGFALGFRVCVSRI
jgi:iron(II)-dependent oxidoreductase